MKESLPVTLVLVALLNLMGCSIPLNIPSGAQPQGQVLQPDRKRVMPPDVSASDLAKLVSGNSAFAFDLYQLLRKDLGNLFYSPHSISLALAMVYAGARGETEQQIKDTLHFRLAPDRLHSTFNGLDLTLAERGKGAEGKDDGGFRLNTVNAIWSQQDYEFLAQFLDIIAENYGAGVSPLNFQEAPEESRILINDWVAGQTEGRITDLIPQGAIGSLTRLVLTNAIYFNARWQYPFRDDVTRDGMFYPLTGGEVRMPMMSQTEGFSYAKGEGYQAVELPYDGWELSMVILLPEAGTFDTFEASLDAERVDAIVNELAYRQVNLTMPKYELESSFSLVQALTVAGMPAAFSQDADFSGMSGRRGLFITDVIHSAIVSVDELGTEAAAASAVLMSDTAISGEAVKFTVDRPFLFFIRDIETDAILFLGRVIDPTA